MSDHKTQQRYFASNSYPYLFVEQLQTAPHVPKKRLRNLNFFSSFYGMIIQVLRVHPIRNHIRNHKCFSGQEGIDSEVSK